MSDFLAKIKLALDGKEQTVKGLDDVQNKMQQLSKTKVTTTFDKEGTVTGKKIEETFSKVNDQAQKATPLMEQFGMAMKRALVVAPVWMILRGAMMAVTNTIQDQVKFLIDLETAMTRIKIVGKGNVEEYKNLQTALVGLAYTYGVAASEAADAAVLFAQQGRNVKETIDLTRTAMLASKILGTDMKTAVDDMTAAVEGFKISTNDATTVVDRWINVSKNFAVTSKDLADATKVAGASANQLGITMSEFLGDVTSIVEVTRKSGAEAARGLSFIYARLFTTGKTTVEQIAKIPFYLDETGKATNTVTTIMRSQSSILEELAGKWDTLTKNEKLEIATSLGSKRQMVALFALMQNYNASLDARIASLTSAGTAEKAFALIQDTTATKLKQVNAAWNALTNAISNTDAIKGGLSLWEKTLITLASLINFEKGYAAVYTKEVNQMQLANETRLNEVKSLEELLSVREKLSKAPKTVENIDRLKNIQDAIDSITKKEPRIRVALETGDTQSLKKSVEDRIKELNMTKIRLGVSIEFEPKIAGVEEKINELQDKLRFTGGEEAVEIRKRLSIEEEKLKELYVEQEKSVTEQYKIQKGQEVAKKTLLDITDEEGSSSSDLTEAEKERLAIERELIKIKFSSANSLELQIQKEIELVKQSKTLYDIHDKNLKLEELNNKLLDARMQEGNQLIAHELELLRIRGASATQLEDAENALKMQLYGVDAVKNSLQYQFDLEKRITKEKLNQVDISNDSVNIFKIAKKYGDDAAKEVSKLLMGQQTYEQFQRFAYPKSKQGFSEFFSQREEQLQAAQYFNLIPGDYYNSAQGRIPIPENQNQVRSINELMKKFLPNAEATKQITIQSLQVNVDVSKDTTKDKGEQAKELQIDIADAIRNDPSVKKALEERISEF